MAKAYTINRAKCVVEMAGNNLLADCSSPPLSAVQLMKRISFGICCCCYCYCIGLYRAAKWVNVSLLLFL